jgi:predicted negative regulator of RcsB-dependent stress response
VQGYTRRQLKEDKFAETAKDAAHWTAVHRRPVVWGIIAIALATGAYFGFITWQNHQNEAANTALGGAMRTFTTPLRPAGTPAGEAKESFASIAERAKQGEKEFKAVADQFDKFPYAKAGKIARYMEGIAAMQAGDTAGAEQKLKAVADSRDKSIAALAKMALATVYRISNRQSDAAKIYKDLQEHPSDTVSKAEAQLEMAEMYESTDPLQATGIYQQIQKENPDRDDPAGKIAAAKLAGAK